VAEINSSAALTAAVEDATVTCLKLSPRVYALSSTLVISAARAPLAIVAAQGGHATLDGGGNVRILLNAGVCHLQDIVLSNGKATGTGLTNGVSDGVHLCPPPPRAHMPTCTAHPRLEPAAVSTR